MSRKLALALALGLMASPAFAQAVIASAQNPNQGDVVMSRAHRTESAAELARTDRQPPGTENGNAPDRAEALAGSR